MAMRPVPFPTLKTERAPNWATAGGQTVLRRISGAWEIVVFVFTTVVVVVGAVVVVVVDPAPTVVVVVGAVVVVV